MPDDISNFVKVVNNVFLLNMVVSQQSWNFAYVVMYITYQDYANTDQIKSMKVFVEQLSARNMMILEDLCFPSCFELKPLFPTYSPSLLQFVFLLGIKTNMDDLLPPGTPQLKKVPSLNRGRSSDPISEEQVKEYKEAWKLFDLDGDGSISRDELRKLMKSTGQVYTEEELTRIIEEADEDGNGEIDFNEFLSIMTAPTSIKDEIKATFDIFDQSRRGFFDFVDIKKVGR